MNINKIRKKTGVSKRFFQRLMAIALFTTVTLGTILGQPGIAQLSQGSSLPSYLDALAQITPQELFIQSQTSYESGQYLETVSLLEQAVQGFEQQGNTLQQAIALSNLSLTLQQLGRWDDATTAVNSALSLLNQQTETASEESSTVQTALAQTLIIQGQLLRNQGQLNAAYEAWVNSEQIYASLQNIEGVIHSQINQGQVLQDLGFHRRAIDILETATTSLSETEASLTEAIALRSLGDALQRLGNFSDAEVQLLDSLQVAQQLNDPDAIAAAHLSLATLFRATAQRQQLLRTSGTAGVGSPEESLSEAVRQYQQAEQFAIAESLQIQIGINYLSLLVEMNGLTEAQTLWNRLRSFLPLTVVTRENLYQQIDLAKSLIQLRQSAEGQSSITSPSWLEIANLLASLNRTAEAFQDVRTVSYVLGTLGELYEATGQWQDAQALTQQALQRSQRIDAADVTYRWQWQLGRIQKQQGDRLGAITAYESAIKTLQDLRSEIVSVDNPDSWLSFRESIEPVHREFVDLLLDPESEPTTEDLDKARAAIESLQLAELDNYFKEACLDTNSVNIETLDPTAAVIYPILLGDRLEVILSIPGQELIHRTTSVSQATVNETALQLRLGLIRDISGIRARIPGRQLYDWMIRPIAQELEQHAVETLVFVLDGALRNVPMAVLLDGDTYLIERYRVALAPGLQLIQSQEERSPEFNILMAGISTIPESSSFFGQFNDLPNVEVELESIRATFPSRVLLNQEFTADTFRNAINSLPYPVVHLATHGKFSSDLNQTFVLTWNNVINIRQLRSLLEVTDARRRVPIELLVLSACETAQGDDRATLGLAGVAVQAGARSTIGTLWKVDDASTSVLMQAFYQAWSAGAISKAEALRQAQLHLLQGADYRSPYFWAPFVLVGNWL